MKRFVLVAIAVAVVALTGCSKTSDTTTSPSTNASASSGGATTPRTSPDTTKTTGTTPGTTPGASAAFCARVRTADEMTKAFSAWSGNPPPEEIRKFAKALDDLEADAPQDLRESIRTVAAAYLKLAALGTSEADATKGFEIILDPTVVKAGNQLEDAAKRVCGIELNLNGDARSGSPSTTPKGTVPAGGGSATGAGYDCDKITSMSSSSESDPTSIYNVKKGMCTAGPSGSWGKAVFSSSGWSSSGSDPATWQVTVYTDFDPPPNLSADDGLNVCKAMATYLASVGSGNDKITIATGSSAGGSDAPKTNLATKSSTGACQAA